jgi:hypothetical protein
MSEATRCIRSLLYDNVIDCTIRVMTDLRTDLEFMVQAGLRADPELVKLLLEMSSESIREALHKRELRITNAIIRAKCELLRREGVEIPDGHQEIDPDDYGGYNW